MDSKTGILLIFCLASVVADSPPIMCPEDKLLECRDSPAMKSLWIEDACRDNVGGVLFTQLFSDLHKFSKFYDTLRNCYAQYSFECAETNNEVYFTMVQEMKTQKEIFCKEKEPVCDQKQLEACFAQNIDMKTTDLQKPDTFPDLCKSYGEFSKCYEQAVIPCYNDPSFQQTSPWESLFGQIKIICLSTPVCNYFEMSKCNSMMYEGLSLVTTIPTSKFITTSCEGYLQYKPCMEPLLGPCERSRLNPFPEFFQQVTSTDRFVSRLCIRHMKDLLVSASTCYDKTAIQSTVDTTCVNPLMTITFAGEPDERQICRKAKSYIECIGTLVGTECPDDTNAVKSISAYQEAWILETLSMIIGINCPPMGFLPTTPPPATTTLSFFTGNGLILPTRGQTSKPTTQAPPPPAPMTFIKTFAPTQPPEKPSSTKSSGGNTSPTEKSGLSDDTSAGDIVRRSQGLLWILLAVLTLKIFL